jgi:hypothetical protein
VLRRTDSDLIEGHLFGEDTTTEQPQVQAPAVEGVRIGKPDTTVTGLAGLAAVDELTERLGLPRSSASGPSSIAAGA